MRTLVITAIAFMMLMNNGLLANAVETKERETSLEHVMETANVRAKSEYDARNAKKIEERVKEAVAAAQKVDSSVDFNVDAMRENVDVGGRPLLSRVLELSRIIEAVGANRTNFKGAEKEKAQAVLETLPVATETLNLIGMLALDPSDKAPARLADKMTKLPSMNVKSILQWKAFLKNANRIYNSHGRTSLITTSKCEIALMDAMKEQPGNENLSDAELLAKVKELLDCV